MTLTLDMCANEGKFDMIEGIWEQTLNQMSIEVRHFEELY